MGDVTGIGWTDHTFNPWIGCARVSPGCQHCYAETRDQRFDGGRHWGKSAERRVTSDANWRKPLRWDRDAAAAGRPALVFCASLADVFEDRPDLNGPRYRLFGLIEQTPHLIWQLLTKRPENIRRLAPTKWTAELFDPERERPAYLWPKNCWIGTTLEDQQRADERIPELLAIPAPVRFLSAEPLLGPVDLTHMDVEGRAQGMYWINALTGRNTDMGRPCRDVRSIDWVIAGGESGPDARPMHPDWARRLRDQTTAAGVPFFFKQWGEWMPDAWAHPDGYELTTHEVFVGEPEPPFGRRQVLSRVGKKAAGRELDGHTWDQFPAQAGDRTATAVEVRRG